MPRVQKTECVVYIYGKQDCVMTQRAFNVVRHYMREFDGLRVIPDPSHPLYFTEDELKTLFSERYSYRKSPVCFYREMDDTRKCYIGDNLDLDRFLKERFHRS